MSYFHGIRTIDSIINKKDRDDNMQNAINIIATIIVSVGGTGVIIVAISKYIGNILAKRIEEKYKNKLDKELEDYKWKINEKLSKLDKIEEKALYISKFNYDNEFKIYMEIWPRLNECVTKTLRLYPRGIENVPLDKEELEKYKENKYKEFSDCFNEFVTCIDKYAPFYQEDYYNDLNKIKEACFFIGDMFFMYEFDVKYNESFRGCRDLTIKTEERKEIMEKEDNILKIKKELLEKIRNYLNGLKLEENINE